MKKKMGLLGFVFFSCILIGGCGKKADGESYTVTVEQTQEQTQEQKQEKKQELETEISTKETLSISNTEETKVKDDSITMLVYTEAPNKNSSVEIQYPQFKNNDALNAMVYDKVQSLAQIDTSLFSSDARLNIDYQADVTLNNNKVVSIIFWGPSSIDDAAYSTSNLITMNVDLHSMKELNLKDLYTTNADFQAVFFEKAMFPENPVTSYDKASFPEMLKLQSPEYQTVDPFSIEGNVKFFLKPDGIVFSLPAVHATGSDHFEAQLKYSDIQQFYLLKQNLWENR